MGLATNKREAEPPEKKLKLSKSALKDGDAARKELSTNKRTTEPPERKLKLTKGAQKMVPPPRNEASYHQKHSS
ncbi:hypothetical protein GCM10007096_31540 [Pullulanibacillus pueri]|uniref:Uncharacterized protein n=1 Tax=Pullulanibacillus pueri TaxID=1437324 RepID=A0A8J3EMT0_9BACL|nr:hypothetical protein GCM10007096_31540 [Pullulanibacillus pueri]